MAAKDLLEHVDFKALECLNEHPSHTVANALKQGYREDDLLVLQSDTDEQLCVNIYFHQKVKLQTLVIKGPADGSGPKRIKLYTNRTSMGFSDMGSVPTAQEMDLTAAQLAGEPIPLKFVKFQSVTVLTIFVESNQGDEEATKISKIAIAGFEGDTFNVKDIKKVDEHA